jgi:hypothetical protein
VSDDKVTTSTPYGTHKYTPRKSSPKFYYVYIGATEAEAAANYNARFERQLAEIKAAYEAKVEEIRARMVHVPEMKEEVTLPDSSVCDLGYSH